jgi:hypothetical protein
LTSFWYTAFHHNVPKDGIAAYSNWQKYVPIDLANLSKVIANEAKQFIRFCKRLLRRQAPRKDRLLEQIFGNH